MEEDLILQQPSDRRLGDVSDVGPPGAENDMEEFAGEKLNGSASKAINEKVQHRRSTSGSPQTKKKIQTRTKRSPTPERKRRRSPSQRRYGSYYSERRRYETRRGRSPEWRRSPSQRDRRERRDRDRYYRGGVRRSNSHSRSRSSTPRKNSVKNRWSPPNRNNCSPHLTNVQNVPQPTTISQSNSQNQQYNMPASLFNESYGPVPYNQYTMQTSQNYSSQRCSYGIQGNVETAYNPSYAPPNAWEGYQQQTWLPTPVPGPVQMQQHAPTALVTQPPVQPISGMPDGGDGSANPSSTHDVAVAQEVEHQRQELKKQRISYIKKTSVLKKELKILKNQRKELFSSSGPPSPTTQGFIDENENLQTQIQRKLNTIENVIDMLSGIIGDENLDTSLDQPDTIDMLKRLDCKKDEQLNQLIPKNKGISVTSSDSSAASTSSSSSNSSTDNDDDSSPERLKHKLLESMKRKKNQAISKQLLDDSKSEVSQHFNYVFYDPEMHWCKICNIFPKTAKDYLCHLHSKEHMDRENDDAPWHSDKLHDQYPTFDDAPVKRTPIRGLTFFVPATAWFCKLCEIWMGDLHCASIHLKSQTHSNKYVAFLEANPHYEVNWLADRQSSLNSIKSALLSPQMQSFPVIEKDTKVVTEDNEKISKKRKRKSSDKKDKKKKKKRSKKSSRNNEPTSSTMSGSDTSVASAEHRKNQTSTMSLGTNNDSSNLSENIEQKSDGKIKKIDATVPIPMKLQPEIIHANIEENTVKDPKNIKFSNENTEVHIMNEDTIERTLGSIHSVISDSEKKLLEQLKGKFREKTHDENITASTTRRVHNVEKYDKSYKEKRRSGSRKRFSSPMRRRSRSLSHGRYRGGRTSAYKKNRRSRSRSKARYSPVPWSARKRTSRSRSHSRHSRSLSRTERKRSRSYDRRRRYSRSRSRSTSKPRVEKPIVKHPQFRPRVPEKEKDKDKEKKTIDTKDRKDVKKKQSSSLVGGKKFPFIGKMPVFKKQTSGQIENDRRNENVTFDISEQYPVTAPRLPVPTAADINMAMMEDSFGNAPPFHPDTGIAIDYDDLMPDPVQFVNIMGRAPPPPPTHTSNDTEYNDEDVLPPGCDKSENMEEFATQSPKSINKENKGQLPKDLEEALNIIFPGEKRLEDNDVTLLNNTRKPAGETQIIVEKPVMQADDLVKEGIHLISISEPALVSLDEASEQSMNEPLNFIKMKKLTNMKASEDEESELLRTPTSENECSENIRHQGDDGNVVEMHKIILTIPPPTDIPMPDESNDVVIGSIYDLEDIPQPPTSEDVEKIRRQEELDDLAMLGIDADDMAAQCI